jgi:hypothetical protein
VKTSAASKQSKSFRGSAPRNIRHGLGAPGRTLLAIAFVASSVACSHFERTRQCHAVADLINPELDAIERLGKSRPRDALALADISQRYARLSRRLTELGIQDEELAAVITEYVGSLTRAAIHTRALADALRSGDLEVASKQRKELQRLSRKEQIQMSQLAGRCRS